MKKISLITTDNKQIDFTCEVNESVIDAAKRNGVYLQYQCNQGTCGSCIAKTTNKNNIKLSGYDKNILNEQDIKSGKVLLCCTQAVDDAVFSLPYPACLIGSQEPHERTAKISKITKLNNNTYYLLLKLEEHPDYGISFDFEPGQFVYLTIPGTNASRPYSIANAPGFTGELEFYIKLRNGGVFSTFLTEKASTEMELIIRGPFGNFILHDNGIKHRLFIAGGCGLASIMSMLRKMAEWQEPHPVTLVFGVWNEKELFALEEIKNLMQSLPKIDINICVNKELTKSSELSEPTILPIYNGDILSSISDIINLKDIKPDVYICGSSGLVNACRNFCLDNSINDKYIYFEHFAPVEFKDRACSIS